MKYLVLAFMFCGFSSYAVDSTGESLGPVEESVVGAGYATNTKCMGKGGKSYSGGSGGTKVDSDEASGL